MIRAILFDIDGTLLDHISAQSAALTEFHARHRAEDSLADLEQFIDLWEQASTKYYEAYMKGAISFKELRELRTQYVYGAHGITLDPREALRLFDEYKELYEKNWKLYPDVIPCLESLSGYCLGVISNGGSGQQRRKLRQTGIDSYFPVQVMSEDISHAKPKKKIFACAAEWMELPPSDIAIVGDNFEADIVGGEKAGLKAVHIIRDNEPLHEGRHATITTLDALQSALSLLE